MQQIVYKMHSLLSVTQRSQITGWGEPGDRSPAAPQGAPVSLEFLASRPGRRGRSQRGPVTCDTVVGPGARALSGKTILNPAKEEGGAGAGHFGTSPASRKWRGE